MGLDLISIGECMVEFFCEGKLANATTFTKAFAGDALNCAVAAARLGSRVGFITKLGNDPFADFLEKSWRRERLDLSQVKRLRGFNGIYFIALDRRGQRQFTYYRRGSAASTLAPRDISGSYLARAQIVFSSGITQAISPSARAAVRRAFQLARRKGVGVAFDPNLRLPLWPSLRAARLALRQVLPLLNIALPSAPSDTKPLLGIERPETVVEFFWKQGVNIVAVKCGARGVCVGANGEIRWIPARKNVRAVDTTGAGDAFNGAFLDGLARGRNPLEAARLGALVAELKLRGRGAVASLPTNANVFSGRGNQ